MVQGQSIFGRDFGKRVIRVALAVVGLLILRAILGALPMVKNASAIGGTLLTPLVVADAVVDTVIFLLILSFGVGLGRTIQAGYTRLPDLGKMISLATVAVVLLLAYGSYQTVVACLLESPSDIVNTLTLSAGAAAGGVQNLMGQLGNAIQGLDKSVMEQAIKTAPGWALAGYQAAAVLAMRQRPDIYGWTFLIFIAIPVIGIVVLVSRNLDTITDMVFHAATATPKPAPQVHPAGTRPSGLGPAGESAGAGDVIEKLAKLKALLDAGVISREEFDGQKTAILKGPPATPEPEELRKLRSLFEAGALTEEEYEAQKRRILAKL
jgi:hypothetical protein